LDVETKSGDLSWRCSAKRCKARVRTDAGPTLVIQQKNDHNHDPDDKGNERHVLRVNKLNYIDPAQNSTSTSPW